MDLSCSQHTDNYQRGEDLHHSNADGSLAHSERISVRLTSIRVCINMLAHCVSKLDPK